MLTYHDEKRANWYDLPIPIRLRMKKGSLSAAFFHSLFAIGPYRLLRVTTVKIIPTLTGTSIHKKKYSSNGGQKTHKKTKNFNSVFNELH